MINPLPRLGRESNTFQFFCFLQTQNGSEYVHIRIYIGSCISMLAECGGGERDFESSHSIPKSISGSSSDLAPQNHFTNSQAKSAGEGVS